MDESITVKSLSDVKWTPVLEAKLEELLIERQFDFNRTALDFSAVLNKDLATCFSEFRIDAKALQLKWTDIEIRRYIMPQMHQQRTAQRETQPAAEDEELPPLETPAATKSNLIAYDSDSGSDHEAVKKRESNLEDLD